MVYVRIFHDPKKRAPTPFTRRLSPSSLRKAKTASVCVSGYEDAAGQERKKKKKKQAKKRVSSASNGHGNEITVGTRVKITWARKFRWGRPPSRWPRTWLQGQVGLVTKVTNSFVWVKVKGLSDPVKKQKHNVTQNLQCPVF
jgi:ribosomal protein L21E